MNVVLWILQVLLAVMFVGAGVMKSTRPKDKLVTRLAWVGDFSPGTVRFIGVVDLLGGLGLILPAVTGVLPWLTPFAATGLTIHMLLAAAIHVRRKEPLAVAFTLVLALLAAVIAWGRLGPYPL